MTICLDCGSEHLGARCGMTFGERIRTVQLDQMSLPARQKASTTYYDRSSLDEALGPDRREKMLEVTKGLGPGYEDASGRLWRRDRHSGEAVEITEKELDDVYMGGLSEADGEPKPF
jgi:hypothetical protein